MASLTAETLARALVRQRAAEPRYRLGRVLLLRGSPEGDEGAAIVAERVWGPELVGAAFEREAISFAREALQRAQGQAASWCVRMLSPLGRDVGNCVMTTVPRLVDADAAARPLLAAVPQRPLVLA